MLDCAVLVVSAVDGVQAHTVTLWRLLKQYKITTMIFVNKMDRQEADREKLLEELKNRDPAFSFCFIIIKKCIPMIDAPHIPNLSA